MAKFRALIVDDSPTMRQFLAMAVNRIGDVNHDQAQNGVEALAFLEKTRYHVALFDINMPEIDGIELLQRVRSDARHDAMRVVMISTDGAPETQDRLLSLGADLYLTKPLSSRLVTDIVRKLLLGIKPLS
jgi:two-component system chemotaxis response regulator CheY